MSDTPNIDLSTRIQRAASPSGDKGAALETSWKGVRWRDSVKAATLAEEIALHFAHDCHDSMCGEDAEESTCETAWVESKLTDFLYEQVASGDKGAAREPVGEVDTRHH